MKHYLAIALLITASGLLAAEPNLPELVEQGNAAFAQSDFDAATQHYDDALAAAPKTAVLHYNKANVHYRRGQYDAAIEALQAAMRHKPKKHLLRNIHFNLGNVYYQQAQAQLAPPPQEDDADAETRTSETGALDRLNGALRLFEQASNEYRSSLALDRKISIAEGRDLHNSGVYAKKNWALARQAWTDTREKIRGLERQNLKLRDGVDELRQLQAVNLPRVEDVYLRSFSDDARDYRLKVLGEYQIDHQDNLQRLRELAAKEVERLNAEVENHKAAVAAADPLENADDPELAKLEQELEQSQQVQAAVNNAAGLQNFVIDAMKRGKPIVAWRNLKAMLQLLDNLVAALDRQDPVGADYRAILADLHSVNVLLRQARSLQKQDADSPYLQMATRSRTLGAEKLAAVIGTDPETESGALTRITTILDHLSDSLDKEPPAPTQPDGQAEQTVFETFFKQAPGEIQRAAIAEAKRVNIASGNELATIRQALADAATLPDELALDSVIEDLERAMALVLTARQPITELLTTTIADIDALSDRLSQVKAETVASQDLALGEELPQLGSLLFEYAVLVKLAKAQDSEAFTGFRSEISAAESRLKAARGAFDRGRQNKPENATALTQLTASVQALRTALFGALLILDPEQAVMVYFDRLPVLQAQLQERLPSADEKVDADRTLNRRFLEEVDQLAELLERVVDLEAAASSAAADDAAPESQRLQARRHSLGHVRRLSKTADQALQFLRKDAYLKRDLLVKDLAIGIEKGKLAFSQQPQDAAGALRLGIDWQERLKEQNVDASSIAVQIGQDKELGVHMAQNQTDVLAVAGRATQMIREQIAGASEAQQSAPGGTAQGTQPAPPADTENLEQALALVQDAISEGSKVKGFLDQAEFHNAQDKHSRVIDPLSRALELLEKPQDQDQDQQDQDQQNQDEQQQQADSSPQRQLTPEQARQLLNRLNKQDQKDQPAKASASNGTVNTPRPW